MSATDAIFSVYECDVTRRTTPRLRQQWACLIERMSCQRCLQKVSRGPSSRSSIFQIYSDLFFRISLWCVKLENVSFALYLLGRSGIQLNYNKRGHVSWWNTGYSSFQFYFSCLISLFILLPLLLGQTHIFSSLPCFS